MSNQIEYQPEGMRRAAGQFDAQVRPQMAQAEALVTDAAGYQSEEKWGTEDLGKPIVFGRMYAERLTKLEDEIHELSSAVGDFAQKVKLAASRADATEEEISQIFTSQEKSVKISGGTPSSRGRSAEALPQIVPLS